MRGYWNRPDETAKVMLDDGWLRTGDIGRIEAPASSTSRIGKKDMILVSGFNGLSERGRGVLARHPGVARSRRVSQPDEHSGEVVAVFIVRRDPALSAQQVIDFARTDLTGYKVPKHV